MDVRIAANDRCEICGVENYMPIVRLPDGSRVEPDGKRYSDEGKPMPTAPKALMEQGHHADMRCAAAHWHDPDPMNCTPGNIKWVCNQCHSRHDMADRAKNISATKRKGKKL